MVLKLINTSHTFDKPGSVTMQVDMGGKFMKNKRQLS